MFSLLVIFWLAIFLRTDVLPLLYAGFPSEMPFVSVSGVIWIFPVWVFFFFYEGFYSKRFSFWDEMSLVGPRPVTQEEIDRYYKDMAKLCFCVQPGITGLWQVSGRSNTGYEYRIALDAWYVRNWNLWLDIMILLKTVAVVLKREGAR